jgi:uncharacterized protein (DUF849 family)
MSRPCIVTVAITGSLPGKKDNPAQQTVELCAKYGRRPATPAEARSILSL